MPRICYTEKDFRAATLGVIQRANSILDDYAAQGFDLTLRQLYYQFVARGLIANRQTEYDKLGSIVNDARLAGLIDWEAIVDRTRNLRGVSHWPSPGSIIRSAASSFRLDKWQEAPHRVEVWIEKDALVGVITGPCEQHDVDYFSCRGYVSQSEMWAAAQRVGEYLDADQDVTIIHLGDHDPSGIDMTRDIRERMQLFLYGDGHNGDRFEVQRIALNMDQVEQYGPPPNPAKITDSRAAAYMAQYGDDSWELDALEPAVIVQLVEDAILYVRSEEVWESAAGEEAEHRQALSQAAVSWPQIVAFLAGDGAE